MNNVTVEEFLQVTEADDYFWVNIRQDKEQLYFGYSNEVPDDVKTLKIKSIYIDWASEALGIDVI